MTSRLHSLFVGILTLAMAGAGLSACKPAAPVSATAATANPCKTVSPDKSSKLPMNAGTDQLSVDCSAWASFIALNWQADPDPTKHGVPSSADWDSFGTPGDMTPKVWESYYDAPTVFSGSVPLKGTWTRPAIKSLSRTSKFGAIDMSDIAQAGSGDHWLTSQRGDVTYYEVLMNPDEFAFITEAGFDLTTAKGQADCASQPGKVVLDGPTPTPAPTEPLRGGLNMPVGFQNGWNDTDCFGNRKAYGQAVGAIEIKAAWTPLPADHSLDYRYKTAQAQILDPVTKRLRQVTVGLVGLHIARKRFPKMPWVWATFEHIDNTPDEAAGGGFAPPAFPANPNQLPSPGFTFFNAKCDPARDPAYACKHNSPPIPCGAGGICMPYNAPMQITRINPVGTTANSVTAYVWSMLPPKSVFNYYRLIDVQWPQAPLRTPPGPGLRVPLTTGDPMPKGNAGGSGQIVANTTLESFQQNSNSCLDCHANFASIASAGQVQGKGPRKVTRNLGGAQAPFASDYSFIFLAETKR